MSFLHLANDRNEACSSNGDGWLRQVIHEAQEYHVPTEGEVGVGALPGDFEDEHEDEKRAESKNDHEYEESKRKLPSHILGWMDKMRTMSGCYRSFPFTWTPEDSDEDDRMIRSRKRYR